jgi:hypothetical protein
MPDPEAEAIHCLHKKITELERRLAKLEGRKPEDDGESPLGEDLPMASASSHDWV